MKLIFDNDKHQKYYEAKKAWFIENGNGIITEYMDRPFGHHKKEPTFILDTGRKTVTYSIDKNGYNVYMCQPY